MKKAIQAYVVLELLVLLDYLMTYQTGYIISDFDSNTIKVVTTAILALAIIITDLIRQYYARKT